MRPKYQRAAPSIQTRPKWFCVSYFVTSAAEAKSSEHRSWGVACNVRTHIYIYMYTNQVSHIYIYIASYLYFMCTYFMHVYIYISHIYMFQIYNVYVYQDIRMIYIYMHSMHITILRYHISDMSYLYTICISCLSYCMYSFDIGNISIYHMCLSLSFSYMYILVSPCNAYNVKFTIWVPGRYFWVPGH